MNTELVKYKNEIAEIFKDFKHSPNLLLRNLYFLLIKFFPGIMPV